MSEKTFEDKLLAELREHVAEREEVAPSKFRGRRRVLIAVAAGTALVAGAGVVVPLVTGGGEPAYGYGVAKDDGEVTIRVKMVNSSREAVDLEREIKRAGIDAIVEYSDDTCRDDRGRGTPFLDGWTWRVAEDGTMYWTIQPAKVRNATFAFSVSRPPAPHNVPKGMTGPKQMGIGGFYEKGSYRRCEP